MAGGQFHRREERMDALRTVERFTRVEFGLIPPDVEANRDGKAPK
jgi:hypothetical protein